MSALAQALGSLAEAYGQAGLAARDQQAQQYAVNRQAVIDQLARAREQRLEAQQTAETQRLQNQLVPIEGVGPRIVNGRRSVQMLNPFSGQVVEKDLGLLPDGGGSLSGLAGLLDASNLTDAQKAMVTAQAQNSYRLTGGDEKSATEAGTRLIDRLAEMNQRQQEALDRKKKYGPPVLGEGNEYIRFPEDPTSNLPPLRTGIHGKAPVTNIVMPSANDPTVDRYSDALAQGKLTMDQVNKLFQGKQAGYRQRIMDAAMAKGYNPQNQLSASAQTAIQTALPVQKQIEGLIEDIDNLKLDKNNTPGYLLPARLKYAMGVASPEGDLGRDIAGLSLGSVIEAASVLKGSSRSIQALKIALQHTPNAWVDSPQLIREKLQTIHDRFEDVIQSAKEYGTKSGLPNTGGTGGGFDPDAILRKHGVIK